MTIQEINELYKKIGIGTEEERDKYKFWEDKPSNKKEYIFIKSSPFSTSSKDKKDAKLA